MKVGPKRYRLALQSPTRTQSASGAGALTTAWATVATVWGQLGAIRGEERITARQIAGTLTHKARIRYGSTWAGIGPSWRVQARGRTFDVLAAVNVGERNRELELELRELVP